MLWLIRITPRPRSRSRSMRLSTSAVWATPSAAVGSSRMTTFGFAEQRARDGDGLALAAGERGDRDAHRGDLGRQLAQQRPGLAAPSPPRRGSGRCSSSRPRKRLRDDVEVVAQREVLEHGGDAEVPAPRRGLAMLTGLPSNVIVPVVRAVHPGEDLDQRRLAGAVVADQGDHLAGVDVQVDVGERLDGAEALGDAAAWTGRGRVAYRRAWCWSWCRHQLRSRRPRRPWRTRRCRCRRPCRSRPRPRCP